jgi:fluoride ion exporter CrcB/FEX
MIREDVPSSTRVPGTRLLLLLGPIGLILIDPVMAHPAGGSQETSHLIANIIGYLILGFMLYVGLSQIAKSSIHGFTAS